MKKNKIRYGTLAIVIVSVLMGACGQKRVWVKPGGADPAPSLTVPQMTAAAERAISDLQTILKRVLDLQQAARKSNDVIKLNCVNDKLLQLKQLLNIAETGRTNLTEAIAAQNAAEQAHQHNQIKVAGEKGGVLRDEAEECIGEELSFLGDTEVTVE